MTEQSPQGSLLRPVLCHCEQPFLSGKLPRSHQLTKGQRPLQPRYESWQTHSRRKRLSICLMASNRNPLAPVVCRNDDVSLSLYSINWKGIRSKSTDPRRRGPPGHLDDDDLSVARNRLAQRCKSTPKQSVMGQTSIPRR